MKEMKIIALLLAVIFLFVGCAGSSDTTKRTGTGAATGAVVGGVVGSFYGSAGAGAAIGAAVGGAGGYVYDQHVKSKDKAYQDGYQAGKQSSGEVAGPLHARGSRFTQVLRAVHEMPRGTVRVRSNSAPGHPFFAYLFHHTQTLLFQKILYPSIKKH